MTYNRTLVDLGRFETIQYFRLQEVYFVLRSSPKSYFILIWHYVSANVIDWQIILVCDPSQI